MRISVYWDWVLGVRVPTIHIRRNHSTNQTFTHSLITFMHCIHALHLCIDLHVIIEAHAGYREIPPPRQRVLLLVIPHTGARTTLEEGRRKEEGGRKKEEGGRRKEEGGRRKGIRGKEERGMELEYINPLSNAKGALCSCTNPSFRTFPITYNLLPCQNTLKKRVIISTYLKLRQRSNTAYK